MSNNNGNSNNVKPLPPHIDKARIALLRAMAAVERARASRGQPGGLTNLVEAEIASGVFVAEHGAAILNYILLKEGLAVDSQEVANVG